MTADKKVKAEEASAKKQNQFVEVMTRELCLALYYLF